MKNDRLRFRAWDPQDQRYYDDFLVSSDGDGAMYSPLEEGEDEGRLIIEQCTGLKDKHENLIYEGDLVNLDGYGVCEVIWSEDTAEFMFKNLSEDLREHVDTMLLYDWEVIGNIHENSEFTGKNK